MKIVSAERGSALVLVLFFVVLIGLLSTPLLFSTRQGQLNTIRGEQSERAYYLAETGALIAQRALYEAVRHEQYRLTPDHLNSIIQRISAVPDVLYDSASPQVTLEGGANDNLQLVSTGQSKAISRTIRLNFNVNPGTPGDGADKYSVPGGIFGQEAVTPTITAGKLQIFKRPDGDIIAQDDTVPKAKYDADFTEYFNAQFNQKPAPLDPVAIPAASPLRVPETPLNVYTYTNPDTNKLMLKAGSLASYALSPGSSNPVCTPSAGSVIIDLSNSDPINCDIVSGGDITINSNWNNLTVNGNIIAAGKITFNTNWANAVTVKKNIISGKTLSVGNMSGKFHVVNGSMSSKENILFEQMSALEIGESLISGFLSTANADSTGIKFNQIGDRLSIGKDLSSQGYIYFSKQLGGWGTENKIGQALLAGKGVYFEGFRRLAIGSPNNSLSMFRSQGTVTFNANWDKLEIWGPIAADKDIFFNSSVNDMTVHGAIRSDGRITFNNTVSGLTVQGPIAATGHVMFNNTLSSARVSGSISSKGSITFKSTVGGLNLLGAGSSILAGSDILFQNTITGLTVPGSLGSDGSITFANTIAGTEIGGSIYSGGTLTLSNAVDGLQIKGSIYTNSTVIGSSNTFPNMTVDGTFLSKGSIEFNNSITGLKVGSYMATMGDINFKKDIGGSPPSFGGLSAGRQIGVFPSYYGNPEFRNRTVVRVKRNPPTGGGSPSSPPTIEFGGWQAR
ncbi:hypothetical protein P9314_22835 [Paenibacillus validus]|uniref:hypothetical protein n=1 Tax=Paenibacillus validus TaxID=44253 RepID=UPI000FD834C9|nr:hypothetical protein [Paenibacillus validus]MED4603468.1 hypothetical protein [Paenibacillus validus]MED4608836.1 hypothetical protein [Paenibacillus validus]